MNLQARTKKTIGVIVVALVVVAAVFTVVVWKLVDSAEPTPPQITAPPFLVRVLIAVVRFPPTKVPL